MPRLYYNILLWLLLPYIFIHLLWRGRKQPEYRQRIPERFGLYETPAPIRPVLWLHTVSVGETRAAVTLVQALQRDYPNHHILLTHTTPTGMAMSEQLFGDSVHRVYLPYDYPFAVQRFLEHFRPKLGVLLETEIWPNLIHHCHECRIPMLLLNARLSERSAAGYARFGGLTSAALAELAGVAAQTFDDATRLGRLGAREVSVMGNLKFEIVPPDAQRELGHQLRELFGASRRVFLAASTREGEEALLLAELAKLTETDLLTVIVPRHPQRFDEVAALIERYGLRYQRRSANQPIAADTQVVLGDSMGEMFAYYEACDLAFIGGSLLEFGGQNLLEACAVGKPVLLGLHTYNFTQAAQQAVAAGAAERVKDANQLLERVNQLRDDSAALAAMGEQGKAFVIAHRGATAKALTLIAELIA
ncbi:3-deoxy-D-manno-octulosonic acid transferase [Ferriphaselus amnicola]|uniref:3-deoxy-D-manno-octulosonic acid transferase n=1 Tax=Ferriphaselus amnicola TaxID=1188319 RepID=A0A2Z6G827_9PROT|nr:lipid IV(A) 3-deoxy-D-manno-octulosonic acid transferase [Ferriphaselus amnicola]BBE49608.1 3-deoxy-D-manno-octulosonic acid transferase [Ferriphaselus amnicola]